ncbi:SDR family NAD(P)-dependent oxidoreductase [Streptomyces sp. DSM 41534]
MQRDKGRRGLHPCFCQTEQIAPAELLGQRVQQRGAGSEPSVDGGAGEPGGVRDPQFAGKRVLVTGASRGIGLAIVRAFQEEGASVTATARSITPELEATGAAFVPADLSTADGPQRMVEAVLAAHPRLDVLVNNAGGGVVPDEAFGDPLDGGDDVWAAGFALNFDAAVRTTRAALPSLTEARGAVVNISSDSARRPGAEPLPYTTAKAALNAFTRQLAERVASPGYASTRCRRQPRAPTW